MPLEKIKVVDVYKKIVREPLIVMSKTKLKDVIDMMIKNPTTNTVFVIDNDRKTIGQMTLMNILNLLSARAGIITCDVDASGAEFLHYIVSQTVEDVMGSPITINKKEKLSVVLEKMEKHKVTELAVVDDDGKICGIINGLEVLLAASDYF